MSATTTRALRLLSLLQSRPVWSGPELADDLAVTTRTVRRDIDRLRELGYPVRAARGLAGGYQLGDGMALPPLLLDDDEAVAVAVSLRLAAGGTVAGASEAALRTLAKLDQVMPARLRSEVRAIADATETLPTGDAAVDGDVLLTFARACRDRSVVRFGYAARSGTQSRRSVEPVRLVASGRRWYLMAWDRDREDWRTFRIDRCVEVEASTFRFPAREHPDPVAFVQRAVSISPYRWQARIRVDAPGPVLRTELSPSSATVLDDGPEHCIVEAGGDDLRWLAVHLGLIQHRIEVLEPPELRVAMGELADTLDKAAGRGPRPPAPGAIHSSHPRRTSGGAVGSVGRSRSRRPRQPGSGGVMEPVYATVNALGRGLLAALGVRVRTHGLDRVPRTGPAILASTHGSFLDFVILEKAAIQRHRYVRFLTRYDAWAGPVVSFAMNQMGHIPVDRSAPAAAALTARRMLLAGEAVGIFPEAGISHSYAVRGLMRGAAAFGRETGAPVVPVALWGAQRIASVGDPRRRPDLTRGRIIDVAFGEPIHPASGDDLADATRMLGYRLTEQLERLQRLPHHLPPAGVAATWHPAHLGGSAPDLARARVLDLLPAGVVQPTWAPWAAPPKDDTDVGRVV